MPQALIPIIIAAAGAATSIGTSIYGAVNAPGDHSAELAKQQADAQAAADAKAKADELASKQNAAKICAPAQLTRYSSATWWEC
jgi:hypothetical protein